MSYSEAKIEFYKSIITSVPTTIDEYIEGRGRTEIYEKHKSNIEEFKAVKIEDNTLYVRITWVDKSAYEAFWSDSAWSTRSPVSEDEKPVNTRIKLAPNLYEI